MDKKTKANNQNEFLLAYYKGEPVLVPIPFAPPSKYDPDITERKKRDTSKANEYASSNIQKIIDPQMMSEKELKILCAQNNLPFYWITGRYLSPPSYSNTQHKGSSRERTTRLLTPKEFRNVLKQLKKINKTYGLIVEIHWHLNRSISKGGGYVTIEELLRLETRNVDADDAGTDMIHLERQGRQGHLFGHDLPKYLWKRLIAQMKEDSLFVFSTKTRGPILPGDVSSSLGMAGEKVGINGISCLSVRQNPTSTTTSPLKKLCQSDWEQVYKTIPQLGVRRCPPKYSQWKIINAYLYIISKGISIKKLPKGFPPSSAVESQLRRWKKKGLFQLILNTCEQILLEKVQPS